MEKKHYFTKRAITAWAIVTWQILSTILAINLSLSHHVLVKMPGEVLLAICMLQWFILEHDFGHGAFFKNPYLNTIFGTFSSLFSLLPFFPWKNIHHAHHTWNGWRDLDPTQPRKRLAELPRPVIFFLDLCWKLWIPVFSIAYAVLTVWNPLRLRALFPQRKKLIQNYFSLVFILFTLVGLTIFYGHFMLTCWLPALVLYLAVADPLLLSQHTHLDAHDSGGKPVRPIKYAMQPAYTRSVVYPRWVAKYILYHFDKHGLHHQHPGVPLYQVNLLPSPPENNIYWLNWLKIAKRTPAHVLIFQSFRETGIRL